MSAAVTIHVSGWTLRRGLICVLLRLFVRSVCL
jgi:hypothetical protein